MFAYAAPCNSFCSRASCTMCTDGRFGERSDAGSCSWWISGWGAHMQLSYTCQAPRHPRLDRRRCGEFPGFGAMLRCWLATSEGTAG